jgi:hypothetical protein
LGIYSSVALRKTLIETGKVPRQIIIVLGSWKW